MKFYKQLLSAALFFGVFLTGCKTLNKSKTGAAIGTSGGSVIGTVVGRAGGNEAMGAIIGATVGGVTGEVIGGGMDKQVEQIKKNVKGVRAERIGEGIVLEFNARILFRSGSAELSPSSEKSLDQLGKVLNTYPDTNIEIQGHTDNEGKDSVNQALSESRANSVAAYLNKKIQADRITTRGFGETAPKYSNDSENGRIQNRRVDFLISANEKMKEQARVESEKK